MSGIDQPSPLRACGLVRQLNSNNCVSAADVEVFWTDTQSRPNIFGCYQSVTDFGAAWGLVSRVATAGQFICASELEGSRASLIYRDRLPTRHGGWRW